MSAYYAPLESEALLHITGPDTLTFLQGQTTCDTRRVSPARALPGAYCTPQGRMVCDFLLGQLGEDHFALRLRASTVEKAAATFGKYIVFSKAELAPSRSDWQVFGCWGDGVAGVLAQLDLALPGERWGSSGGEGYLLVQLDEAATRFELWIDTANHRDQLATMAAALSEGQAAAWEALQIRAGIGRVEGATAEEFLPQMLNYDLTGHVSFSKGCYTGQEIIARLHYRGKAKRRMYLARWLGDTALTAGTTLYAGDSSQGAGTVVNCAAADSVSLCLVAATKAGVASGLHPAGAQAQLEILPLPYTVDD